MNSTRNLSNRATARVVLTIFEVLVVLAIIGIVVAILLPATRSAREPARRTHCMNNLKQIATALQDYAKVHGTLPPAYTTDASGKPLHSWRTLILPYMEENAIYNSIDLTKPWDDPANADACKMALAIYQCPSAPLDDNRTTYLAAVTPGSCMRATEPRPLPAAEKAANALTIIEVDESHAVPWMSPVDADEQVILALGGPNSKLAHSGITLAAFADGHVQSLDDDMPADQRRELISIADGDRTAEATE